MTGHEASLLFPLGISGLSLLVLCFIGLFSPVPVRPLFLLSLKNCPVLTLQCVMACAAVELDIDDESIRS